MVMVASALPLVARNPSVSVAMSPHFSSDIEEDEDDDSLWLDEKINTASSWCAAHGVLMGSRNVYEPAPFALEPSPFPKVAFDKCYDLGKPWNHIVHAIAQNYQTWLRPTLLATASCDPEFTGKLLSLADEVVQQQQKAQRVALGIFRSDYLLQKANQNLEKSAYPLQVELNTISSGCACLSTKVTQLHQFLCHNSTKRHQLINNRAAVNVVDGLAAAFHEYTRQRFTSTVTTTAEKEDYPPVVIMIDQPHEANICDQRNLEFLLFQRHGIKLVRKSLHNVATHGKYSSAFQNKELIVPSSDKWVAAAVVYYRAGYTPNDYPTEKEWEARSLIEHSAAIKCPDVFYHLVGTKKVQQAIAANNALRQFCRSDTEFDLVTSSFANLYSLGGEDDSDAVTRALQDPHSYVLKPQREGGGNNFYGEQMVQALQKMTRQQRSAYILMQRIQPPTFTATLVRGGKAVLHGAEAVCELGVFSISLREYCSSGQGRILVDTVGGHILRTKSATDDEGGLMAGYAYLSSPRLID